MKLRVLLIVVLAVVATAFVPRSVSSLSRLSSPTTARLALSMHPQTPMTLKERMTAAGRGALLSYGVLNFLYYVTLTTVAWTFSSAGRVEATAAAAAVTSGSHLSRRVSVAAVRLGKVMGIVWAGSQITKPARITGAIVTAPAADKLLNWFQNKLKLKSAESAFAVLCAILLGSTAVFYALLLAFSASV